MLFIVTGFVRKLSNEYSHLITDPPAANPLCVKVNGVPEHTFIFPPVTVPEGAPEIIKFRVETGLLELLSVALPPYSIRALISSDAVPFVCLPQPLSG